MKRQIAWLLALGVTLSHVGCSSSDCADTRTCGGGSSASTIGKACETAAECDDHRACNGLELCTAKKCAAGTPACSVSDPNHCEATCKESSGGPVCGVQGRDADDDGYKDALCKEDPGDDCDDAHDTAYPGAQEVCDGIDNDCNGKADVEDGLTAYGENKTLLTSTGTLTVSWPAIVWAPEIQSFGVVFTVDDGTNQFVALQVVSPTGTSIGPYIVLGSLPSKAGVARIAWNGSSFGVVWEDTSSGSSDVFFVAVNGTTNSPSAVVPVAKTADDEITPSVAAAGKYWLVTWQRVLSPTTYALQAQALEADGSLATGTPVELVPSFTGFGAARIAAGPNQAVVAWTEGSPTGSVKYRLLDGQLASTSSGTWSDTVAPQDGFVQVAAASDGVWLGAWQSGSPAARNMKMARLSGAGAKDCSEPVATGSSSLGPAAVAPLPLGSAVAYSEGPAGGALSFSIATAGKDCKRIQAVKLTSSAYSTNALPELVGDMDASATAIAAVWIEQTGGKSVVKIRNLGPALCDAPK